jgi:hypothetical protein
VGEIKMNKDNVIKLADLYKKLDHLQKKKDELADESFYLCIPNRRERQPLLRTLLSLSKDTVENLIDSKILEVKTEIENLGGCI